MKCNGLPRGPCPQNASGKYVKLCQSDLMLCDQYEQAIFNINNHADKQENADTDANNDSQGSDLKRRTSSSVLMMEEEILSSVSLSRKDLSLYNHYYHLHYMH